MLDLHNPIKTLNEILKLLPFAILATVACISASRTWRAEPFLGLSALTCAVAAGCAALASPLPDWMAIIITLIGAPVGPNTVLFLQRRTWLDVFERWRNVKKGGE